MTTLITGGAKCGKSRLGEQLLDCFSDNKYYIATMRPYGEEAEKAIERHHLLRAGKNFITIEKYTDLHEIRLTGKCRILLECIANLCANEMFRNDEVCDPKEQIIRGIDHIKKYSETLVIITNNVGSDGNIYSAETQKYIEYMGSLNTYLADISDNVIECVYGVPVILKGKL